MELHGFCFPLAEQPVCLCAPVVLEPELSAGLTMTRVLQELPALPLMPRTTEPKPDAQVAVAPELSVFSALQSMPEPKLDVRVAEAQALSEFLALP